MGLGNGVIMRKRMQKKRVITMLRKRGPLAKAEQEVD